MSSSLASPILVVAHDAGGAELVAAWSARHASEVHACVAEGPAERVFAKGSLSLDRLERDAALERLSEFASVLTGTSWKSDLERCFVERAASLGLETVSYLDHWTDYRSRFVDGDCLVLPQELWVADEHAEAIAGATFPGVRVRNVGNPYLEDLAARIKVASRSEPGGAAKKRILFVSEPLGAAAEHKYGDPAHFGYTELEALAEFVAYVRQEWSDRVESMRIRRHPAEPAGKFRAFVDAGAPIPIVECGEADLVDDCAWADWIVGCQSMAMVVGLMAGKPVFSVIPRRGRPSAIPHPEIVSLFRTDSAPDQRRG